MGEVGSQFRGGGTAISRWDEQEEAAWRDVRVWNGQVGRSIRRRMRERRGVIGGVAISPLRLAEAQK